MLVFVFSVHSYVAPLHYCEILAHALIQAPGKALFYTLVSILIQAPIKIFSPSSN
jgi:hypothetical protein